MRPRRGSKPVLLEAVTNQGRATITWACVGSSLCLFGAAWSCCFIACDGSISRACGVRARSGPLGDRQKPTHQGLHAVPGALGEEAVLAGDSTVVSQHYLGQGLPSRSSMSCSGGSSTGNWDRSWRSASMRSQYGKGQRTRLMVYQIEQPCTRLLWTRPRADHGELRSVFHADWRRTGKAYPVCVFVHVETFIST